MKIALLDAGRGDATIVTATVDGREMIGLVDGGDRALTARHGFR